MQNQHLCLKVGMLYSRFIMGEQILSMKQSGEFARWNYILEILTNESRTGVPQIILPIWADLYDYAIRTEWLGVGIWASRRTAPSWTSEEIGQAFLRAIGNGEEAKSMRRR